MQKMKIAAALLLTLCLAMALFSACGKADTASTEANAADPAGTDVADTTAQTTEEGIEEPEPVYREKSWGAIGLFSPARLAFTGAPNPETDLGTEIRLTDPDDAKRSIVIHDLYPEDFDKALAEVREAHAADGLADLDPVTTQNGDATRSWEGVSYEEDGGTVCWLYHWSGADRYYQVTVRGFDLASEEVQLVMGSVWLTAK